MKTIRIIMQILGNSDIRELILMLIEALKDKKLSRDEKRELIEKVKDIITNLP